MSERLAFTIDELDLDRHVMAVCRRCMGTRYLIRPYLREVAPGQTLAQIESRVRCIERPRGNGRAPACGAGMEIEFYRRANPDIEARPARQDNYDAMTAYMNRRLGPR